MKIEKYWAYYDGDQYERAPDEVVTEEQAIAWGEANLRDGEWGHNERTITADMVQYSIEIDADGDEIPDSEEEIDRVEIGITIETNHEALILDVVGHNSPCLDCDHEWVSCHASEGGLRENPGVFGGPGAAVSSETHCRKCGLIRCETSGDTNEDGNSNGVEYTAPPDDRSWRFCGAADGEEYYESLLAHTLEEAIEEAEKILSYSPERCMSDEDGDYAHVEYVQEYESRDPVVLHWQRIDYDPEDD